MPRKQPTAPRIEVSPDQTDDGNHYAVYSNSQDRCSVIVVENSDECANVVQHESSADGTVILSYIEDYIIDRDPDVEPHEVETYVLAADTSSTA